MSTDSRDALQVYCPMRRDGAEIPGCPRLGIFPDRLRRNAQPPPKLGPGPDLLCGFANWVFSIHDAVKIGTFGSECQAETDTVSSFESGHDLGMDIKKEFSYRLNLLFSAEGVPEKYRGRMEDLSKEFCVTPKTISNWLNGIKMPQLETIMLIALRHNCNAEWLLTGRGPMRPEPNPIKLDETEKTLVNTYRELRPEDQKKLFQVAEVFKPSHNDTAI